MMKKELFLAALLITLFTNAINAQTTFDFESLTIPLLGYWNGSDEIGSFGNSEISFNNNYNIAYESWNGFSYAYDTITSDKQYAAFANSVSGHIFGIGYIPSDWEGGTYDNIPISCKFNVPVSIFSIDIANSEYAVDVILNGSAYGEPAFSTDDYFKLIIEGFYNNESTGIINFMLADYTERNSNVLNIWEEIDLSLLETVDNITFNLESTHTGDYGMNTPAYFCLDNIKYSDVVSINEKTSINLFVFPNPAKNFINIRGIAISNIIISDITGKIVYTKNNCLENEKVDISNLVSGIYFIRTKNNSQSYMKKLIIE